MTGTDRIAAERQRQITELGYNEMHDAEHDEADLAFAAACYAAPTTIYLLKVEQGKDFKEGSVRWVEPWPLGWERRGRAKTKEMRLRELEKAGALIAAEIDRLLAQDDDETDG